MTLQIIGVSRSNFTRTVRMVAHEKGIAYEHISAFPHSDEVKAIHPLGQIPVMRHDGLELAESQAIARYLDSAFDGPALIPAEPAAAARVNQWISMTATSVDQLLIRRYVVEYAFHKDDDGNVIRTEIDKAVKRFPRMFAVLDQAVAPGFLGNESFSMADCFLAPMLAAVQNYPEGQEHFGNSEALKAYFARIAERPSFVETAP
jgi:glutathione S-transferase